MKCLFQNLEGLLLTYFHLCFHSAKIEIGGIGIIKEFFQLPPSQTLRKQRKDLLLFNSINFLGKLGVLDLRKTTTKVKHKGKKVF